MTGQTVVMRHGYGIVAALLVLGIVVLAGFLVLVALPDLTGSSWFAGVAAPTATPTTSPTPSPSTATVMSPIGIEMAPDSDCTACHVTATGTVGTKPIPNLAHPLWGFRDCTACHANDRLVKTAPGHSGLHKDDCLVCHKVPADLAAGTTAAPLRPEHMGGDKACTDCHGVDKHAPLPASMAGRDNCWICHNGKEFTYLFEATPAPLPDATPEASPGASPEALGGARYVLATP
jgi:hypothetical protein